MKILPSHTTHVTIHSLVKLDRIEIEKSALTKYIFSAKVKNTHITGLFFADIQGLCDGN